MKEKDEVSGGHGDIGDDVESVAELIGASSSCFLGRGRGEGGTHVGSGVKLA